MERLNDLTSPRQKVGFEPRNGSPIPRRRKWQPNAWFWRPSSCSFDRRCVSGRGSRSSLLKCNSMEVEQRRAFRGHSAHTREAEV